MRGEYLADLGQQLLCSAVILSDQELKRKGVTLYLLWREYLGREPAGYRYSQFAEHYRRWLARVEPVMRQVYKAGEKAFVDNAGVTVDVVDPATGEIHEAQVFVAALGASNYTFAEATWTQQLPDWIGSHVRAVEYFGGAPELFVPDNPRSGVTKPCYYEPVLNQSYAEFAAHYQSAVLPARVRRPRDKSKVETAVQIVEREISD
jgi:transposase